MHLLMDFIQHHRTYVFEDPKCKCITDLHINESKQYKIDIDFTNSIDKKSSIQYSSGWRYPQEKLDHKIDNILHFTEPAKQLVSSVFDYNSIITDAGIIKRFQIKSPYKEYYISTKKIGSYDRFRRKFQQGEWREFWLYLDDSFAFTIQNLSCKLPSIRLKCLHNFSLNSFGDDWSYQMQCIILRNEYPISNLYQWAFREISVYTLPRLIDVLKVFVNENLCRIIFYYWL